MRKDPPVDQGYLTATWILDHADTLVLNAPTGLRSLNVAQAAALVVGEALRQTGGFPSLEDPA